MISAATRCARVRQHVGDQHRRTVARQAMRDGLADAGAAAGHQGDVAGEPHAASSSMAMTRAGAPSLSGSLTGRATTRLRGARQRPGVAQVLEHDHAPLQQVVMRDVLGQRRPRLAGQEEADAVVLREVEADRLDARLAQPDRRLRRHPGGAGPEIGRGDIGPLVPAGLQDARCRRAGDARRRPRSARR